MSENKGSHVLVPIEWLKEQKKKLQLEYTKGLQENSIEETQLLTEHFTYTIILNNKFPEINPSAQQERIKELEDALESIEKGVEPYSDRERVEWIIAARYLANQALQSKTTKP